MGSLNHLFRRCLRPNLLSYLGGHCVCWEPIIYRGHPEQIGAAVDVLADAIDLASINDTFGTLCGWVW